MVPDALLRPEGITTRLFHKDLTSLDVCNKLRLAITESRLFGRQKPVHNVLGGGKSADVLLWRNKKISASVLTGATAIWVIFEWLNYHLLTMVFFALLIGMLAQFAWSNASRLVNRQVNTPSKVPRVRLLEELFANIGVSIGAEVNRFLGYLQNVACGGNLKQFLMQNKISDAGHMNGSDPGSTSYVRHLQSYGPGMVPNTSHQNMEPICVDSEESRCICMDSEVTMAASNPTDV
ncbi:hypothetical protein IFM89_018160 [Coptis chinensis]|uniref:Reticulon-like protein n=1 Tax=Coptis chinensis TaxID=261450 RepID=A0A835LYI3_9MAGN|nr:hypothetical protein IFM89_018160 [Coptis chinensis]